MQAVLRAALTDLARSAGTGLTLWAGRPTCPACSPVLNCGEVVRCPDCICEGANRRAPISDCGSCWWPLFVGVICGFLVAIGLAVACAQLRRQEQPPSGRAPLPPPYRTRRKQQPLRGLRWLHSVGAVPRRGQFALARYNVGGRAVYHSRLIVAVDPGGPDTSCYILTPDGDEYVEELVVDGDHRRIDFLTHWRAYPPDIPAADVHEFLRLSNLAARGVLVANAFNDFNADPTPETAPAGPPGPAIALPAHDGLAGLWAALGDGPAVPHVPPGDGRLVPALVVAAVAAPVLAPAAPIVAPVAPAAPLAPAPAVGTPALGDVRILPITRDTQGNRFKEFRSAVNSLQQDDWPDWPVSFPRTCLWVCRYFVRQGLTASGWFQKFRHDAGLGFMDEGVEELQRDCKMLDTLLTYDQINVANLASADQLCRNIQVVAHLYADRFASDRDDSYERNLMYGAAHGEQSLPISPELREHLAVQLSRRSAIEKERREAQETRAIQSQARGGRPRGRGRGKAPKGEPDE